jgi:hypothetical protein
MCRADAGTVITKENYYIRKLAVWLIYEDNSSHRNMVLMPEINNSLDERADMYLLWSLKSHTFFAVFPGMANTTLWNGTD